MNTFGKFFVRQDIHFGYFLCDRVKGAERFSTHPRQIPSQVTIRVTSNDVTSD